MFNYQRAVADWSTPCESSAGSERRSRLRSPPVRELKDGFAVMMVDNEIKGH